MNKKSTLGLVLFSIGTVVDCLGILVVSLFLGTGLLLDSSGKGLPGSRVCMIAGPAVIFIGVVILLIGYIIVCKYYVAKPKEKKETAPRTAKPVASVAAPAYVSPGVAGVPNGEKTGFAPQSPLAVTKITYIFCGNCGTRNEADGGFCVSCGQRL